MSTLLPGGSTALWYTTRGTGLVALVLLTASVVLGLLTTVRFSRPTWPRLLTSGLHRNISLLVLVFLAVHVTSAVLDPFAPIGWPAAIVPFTSPYRPVWLGLGAVALDLLLALVVSSLLRLRLGYRGWRAVHWLAYACWPVAVAHGMGTGTDTRLSWVLAVDAGCVAAVLGVLWWRLASGWPAQAGVRATSAVLSALTPVALGGWLLAGPLAPHWAARSGTPAALLAGGQHPSTAAHLRSGGTRARTAPHSLPTAPFTTRLSGRVSESKPNSAGEVAVDLSTRLSGHASGVLDIVIDGFPGSDGGVTMTDSRITLGPLQAPRQYRGRITGLAGTRLRARVASADRGRRLILYVSLRITGNHVAGRVRAEPNRPSR